MNPYFFNINFSIIVYNKGIYNLYPSPDISMMNWRTGWAGHTQIRKAHKNLSAKARKQEGTEEQCG
jgi:hypothetical protein